MKYLLVAVLCAAGVVSQAQTADDYPKDVAYAKFIERIAGQWALQEIVDAEKLKKDYENPDKRKPKRTNDVETDQTTNAMSKIEFYDNARYRMSNSQQAIDSGSYRLNEQHGILYLESDQDPTPVEWKITLKDERLTLTGRGQDASSRYRYVYRKTRENVVR